MTPKCSCWGSHNPYTCESTTDLCRVPLDPDRRHKTTSVARGRICGEPTPCAKHQPEANLLKAFVDYGPPRLTTIHGRIVCVYCGAPCPNTPMIPWRASHDHPHFEPWPLEPHASSCLWRRGAEWGMTPAVPVGHSAEIIAALYRQRDILLGAIEDVAEDTSSAHMARMAGQQALIDLVADHKRNPVLTDPDTRRLAKSVPTWED